jgi:hypothetical protein
MATGRLTPSMSRKFFKKLDKYNMRGGHDSIRILIKGVKGQSLPDYCIVEKSGKLCTLVPHFEPLQLAGHQNIPPKILIFPK